MEFEGADIPSHQNLRDMPYLLAIIKETQRLYPSLAQMLFRRSLNDYVLPDGRVIPKDTVLTINVWQINRDPKAWEDPDEFRPERFLNEAEKNNTTQGPNYFTFSNGKRICKQIDADLS